MRSYLSPIIGAKASEVLLSKGPVEPQDLVKAPEDKLIEWIGKVRTRRLKAAFNLGKACWLGECEKDPARILIPKHLFKFIEPRFKGSVTGNITTVLLSSSRHIKGVTEITESEGTICTTEPCRIFRPAVSSGAPVIAVAHKHLDGDPTPSQEDLAFTRRLVVLGNMLGVRLLDHIIVGWGNYTSVRNIEPELWKG